MTRGELVATICAVLDERLCVEDPHPFGPGIAVALDDGERVNVIQPGGPHFVVVVHEGQFS